MTNIENTQSQAHEPYSAAEGHELNRYCMILSEHDGGRQPKKVRDAFCEQVRFELRPEGCLELASEGERQECAVPQTYPVLSHFHAFDHSTPFPLKYLFY